MFENNQNPLVKEKIIDGKDCIHFIFRETFTYDEAASFVAEWKQQFELNKDKKVVIIWELLEMKSYETVAREVLQKAIKDLRHKIEMIWLITDSILIQAEAEIISFFTSYHINIVKSEEEMLYKITNQENNLA